MNPEWQADGQWTAPIKKAHHDHYVLRWTKSQKKSKTSYYSYARPAQPGPIRIRLYGPCIAAIAGD